MTSAAPPSPSPAPATLVVSGISAVAEWSEPATDFAPPSPTPRRNRQSIMSMSMSMSSPGEQLRARLRSLSEIDTQGDGTPAAALATLTARPSRPSSTINASPHPPSTPSRRGTPGRTTESVTPTGAAGASAMAQLPLSPTPTRRHRPSSMLSHNFRHSMPDPLILVPEVPERPTHRPTTRRLRQPTQLSMGEAAATRDSFSQPRSRRPSTMTLHLEPASPPRRGSATTLELPVSPILTSSPGSLMSDNGTSSPTTSVESLTLGIPSLSLDNTRVADKWRRDIPDPSTSFRVFGDESIDSERFLDFDDI
ncbi:hypothetical protein Q8F55_004860 [Vanrija albida]|uniref:Uncharacterized protein n=1 Tax=Vanrija albida TaxID=181172 RepID=A0ABR3Q106_9TREE